MLRFGALALIGALGAACGDNVHPPDAAPLALLDALRALPNVHDATAMPTALAGYTYVVLHVTQPVDHANPSGQTFLQEVSLIHRDFAAPLIIQTSGYWDYYLDNPVEPTLLLDANQISIEHRYFGTSRPDPADWTKLTIEQMAADEHAIVAALGQLYGGPKLATGGSKGGMTAIFYRRFFPDDVAGTVPYVAPISYGAPDPRYVPYLEQVGTAACRAAVRAAAVEMLEHRRAALLADATASAAQNGFAYTRVAIGPALESAIVSLEWSFWQYVGIGSCPDVPATTGSDAAMYAFLEDISPVEASDDAQLALFEAYDYQAYSQLGYPDDGTEDYLMAYEQYTAADYAGSLPTAQPAYDGGSAMADVGGWVASQGDALLFVYGQWDPWSGGMYALGSAADSLRLVEAQGTHDSDIAHLADSDEQAALDQLAAWTGVTPDASRIRDRLRAPGAGTLRIPPAARGALRARHRTP